MNAAFWVVVFAGLMFGAGWLFVRWLTARGTAEYRQEAAKLEQISSLSLQEAASKAVSLLSDGKLFRYAESPIADEGSLDALAPEIRKLLGRYEAIEVVKGPRASVARSSIGASEHKPGFLRIGSVATATDAEGEIAVRPGDETVYELYAQEAPDPVFGTYKTIYHWLIAMAEEAK